VIHNHVKLLRRSVRGLQQEGFRIVHTLSSVEAIEAAEIAGVVVTMNPVAQGLTAHTHLASGI
jgi:hypothetical protein